MWQLQALIPCSEDMCADEASSQRQQSCWSCYVSAHAARCHVHLNSWICGWQLPAYRHTCVYNVQWHDAC